jgi:hypothetical protein
MENTNDRTRRSMYPLRHADAWFARLVCSDCLGHPVRHLRARARAIQTAGQRTCLSRLRCRRARWKTRCRAETGGSAASRGRPSAHGQIAAPDRVGAPGDARGGAAGRSAAAAAVRHERRLCRRRANDFAAGRRRVVPARQRTADEAGNRAVPRHGSGGRSRRVDYGAASDDADRSDHAGRSAKGPGQHRGHRTAKPE